MHRLQKIICNILDKDASAVISFANGKRFVAIEYPDGNYVELTFSK